MAVGSGHHLQNPVRTTNQNYVWNTSLLAWEAMEQPTISSDVVNVAITNPLPVSGPLTDTQLRSSDVKVTLDSETVTLTESGKAQVIYEDGDVLYVCKAAIGTALTSASWQIQKVNSTTGVIIQWCDGNANYDNVATNPAGLSYS